MERRYAIVCIGFAFAVVALSIGARAFRDRYLNQCFDHDDDEINPPFIFGLPSPTYTHNDGAIVFKHPNATLVLWWLHGRGTTVYQSYWHIGELYRACNCTVIAILYPRHCTKDNLMERMASMDIYDPYIQLNSTRVFMGTSLGTAVLLASFPHLIQSVDAIILENPFTTIGESINHAMKSTDEFFIPFSYIVRFLAWFIVDAWDSREAMRRNISADVPALFITSEKDEIIPPYMSKQLMRPGDTQVILPGSKHGHAAAHRLYVPTISNFLRTVKKREWKKVLKGRIDKNPFL